MSVVCVCLYGMWCRVWEKVGGGGEDGKLGLGVCYVVLNVV